MRILILQFVSPGRRGPLPRFDHELGVAAALLKAEGFEVSLAALQGYSRDRLHQAVVEHRPVRVVVQLEPTSLAAARHSIADLAERELLPVILVGRYATARPAEAISIPGVSAVIPGEYDQTLLDLCRRLRAGKDPAGMDGARGVWLNSEEGLVRSEPAPLVEDLDALPPPDREIFQTRRLVEATGEVGFQATRGCREWCGYCLNDWYLELYAGRGEPLRRRSVDNLLTEIEEVIARYQGVQRVGFRDHAFATDTEWLEEFAGAYPQRCGLRFRCHVRLSGLDPRTPALLARSGCELAEVEIGSGSNFIRQEVLSLRLERRQIVEGVGRLHEAGLKVRASVFVGAPYETEVSVDQTLRLLAELPLETVRARVFYPLPGTRAAEICAENGWISGRGEENFHAARSVLDMPTLPVERINDLARQFHLLLKRRRNRGLRAWLRRLRKTLGVPLRELQRGARGRRRK